MTSHYDPLLAKLIVAAPDREAALGRLGPRCALRRRGPATNVAYLRELADNDDVPGRLDTGLLERLGGGSGRIATPRCRRSRSSP